MFELLIQCNFFPLSFTQNWLKFGYIILEHVFYARMKLVFFFQFNFLPLFFSS